MYSLPTNYKVPGSRLAIEVPFTRASISAQNALALTSRQRAISVDRMHTVARLLRHVGPLLEAAALRDAMQDEDASEFVTAVIAQAEASTSGDSGIAASSSTIPSVSFLHGNSVGMAASARLSNMEGTPSTVKLATVLRTRNTGAAATSPAHSVQDNTTTFGSLRVRARPQLSSTLGTSSGSSVRTDARHNSTRTCSSHSDGGRSRDAPTAMLSPDARTPTHSPADAEADANPYGFPVDWFDTAAIGRLSRLHPVARGSVDDLSGHRIELPPLLSTPPPSLLRRGVQDRALPSSNMSAASVSDSNASPSLPTMVFPATETPLSTPSPSPRHHVGSAAGRDAPLHVPLHVPASPSRFHSHASVSGVRGPLDDFTTVTTAQPPLFVDGMLLDPDSGRFLFGGHAFREEARVLYVPSTLPSHPGGRDPSVTGTSVMSAAAAVVAAVQRQAASRLSTTVAPSSGAERSEAACLLLLREYFPVSVVLSPDSGGDGGHEQASIDAARTGSEDIVVQCYSMLPPWLTQVPPNRYHLLTEAVTIACVCQATPGCVTAVTSLSRFLRGHGFMSAATTSISSHPTSPSVNTISALGGLLRMPGTSGSSQTSAATQDSRNTEHALTTNFPLLDGQAGHSGYDPRGSLAQSIATAPLVKDRQDMDAARIIAVAERLSVVPPDVLDDALAAVRHCLAFHLDYTVRRQRIRDVLAAVRVMQRFFRRCLAVKRRAVRRMMRVWRKLEVEARLKLQQHRALPSAVERIDAVANGILQDHMLTSVDYKRAFIQDEWTRRRADFALWMEEEDWHALFAEQEESVSQPEAADALEHPRRSTVRGGNHNSGGGSSSSARPRSARLTAEEEQHMEDAFVKRNLFSLHPKEHGATAGGVGTPPLTSTLVAAGVAAVRPRPSTSSSSSQPTLEMANVAAQRRDAALHRFRSWYIDPYELLFLSHRRLLQSLKGTVLRMEEVQSELNRAAVDVARDAAGHVT